MELIWVDFIMPFVSEFVIDILLPLLLQLLGIAALFILTMVGRWWKNLQIEGWIKDMVIEGVLYAQETFWDKAGKEKFSEAIEYITEMLDEKGVEISNTKLIGMIQSTVKEFKADFGDLWYKDPEKSDK